MTENENSKEQIAKKIANKNQKQNQKAKNMKSSSNRKNGTNKNLSNRKQTGNKSKQVINNSSKKKNNISRTNSKNNLNNKKEMLSSKKEEEFLISEALENFQDQEQIEEHKKEEITEKELEETLSLRDELFDLENNSSIEKEQSNIEQNKEEEIKDRKNPTKKKKRGLIINIILLVLSITVFTLLISVTPKIFITGDEKIILEYNKEYKEEGATAKYFRKDYTNKIRISGKVDTKKIGTYKITYELKFSSYSLKKERIIEIVDKKKPVIKLIGEDKVNICPNGKYEEDGVTAYDEYDKDLTDKIERIEEKGKIIYKVKDSSGNETMMIRELIEIDKEKPILELVGSSTLYVEPNKDYKEPGYKATDNCDQDITKNVTVTGNVDTSKLGSYTLTYEVTDKAGNKSSVKRTVIVTKKTDPESGSLKTGAIYLTFDDGPNNGTTNRILDILKEEGVHATFFVTANGPDNLLKREQEEGHSIALHTASHNYSYVYSSKENYFEDLKKVSDRVKRVTGQETKLIRFPGGSSNTISRHYKIGIMTELTNEVLEQGYRYYDWNVDASDAWQCAKNNVSNKKDCVYNNVTKNLSKSKANVVLMHDVKSHTADALRDIIHYAKENGYTFEVIDSGTKMVRFKVNN